MTAQSVNNQISNLRMAQAVTNLEIVASVLVGFFMSLLPPQMLIRYVYRNSELLEAPAIFEQLPVIIFAIVTVVSIFGVVVNLVRYVQIMKLSGQLKNMESCSCDCHCCETHHDKAKKNSFGFSNNSDKLSSEKVEAKISKVENKEVKKDLTTIEKPAKVVAVNKTRRLAKKLGSKK